MIGKSSESDGSSDNPSNKVQKEVGGKAGVEQKKVSEDLRESALQPECTTKKAKKRKPNPYIHFVEAEYNNKLSLSIDDGATYTPLEEIVSPPLNLVDTTLENYEEGHPFKTLIKSWNKNDTAETKSTETKAAETKVGGNEAAGMKTGGKEAAGKKAGGNEAAGKKARGKEAAGKKTGGKEAAKKTSTNQ